MKKYFVLAGVLLVALAASATSSPYSPEVDARFASLEANAVGGVIADGKIIVGNDSNVGTAVTPSGAATMTNAGVISLSDTTTDGNYAVKVAKASFTCASSGCTVGAHTLGVSLPAKALIVRSYIHVTTQLADAGTCTHAFSCEDANNIKTATDLTGTAADGLIEGESTGAATAFKKAIAATCVITFTVADGGSCVPSTGAGAVFVEYVVLN